MPRKLFIFGLCVMALIFGVSAVFPEGIQVGRLRLRVPDYRVWFRQDTPAIKDIGMIVASVDTADFSPTEVASARVDSSAIAGEQPQEEKRKPVEVPLFEFPEGQDTLLFRVMRAAEGARQVMRVLHYGDSQIEGDCITGTIRNYMQRKYGGQGIGFLPVTPATAMSVTFQQDVVAGWQRFSVLDRNRDSLKHRLYGIDGSFSRYVPADGGADSAAHIGLLPFYLGYRNARSFKHARLFYGRAVRPFALSVNGDSARRMRAVNMVQEVGWRFGRQQRSLDLWLTSRQLPDVYGITLDGDSGVAVDNLSMRGSSGLEFSRMDTALTGRLFRMMNVELLIVQFGANLVPYVVDDYDDYARRFAQELRMLRRLKRGLTIVVVGVNDMAQNGSDGFRSYPNVRQIRDVQRKAAFEAGCVFWDLYEAMGGDQSMVAWVRAKPPLARKDYIHFNAKGAKVIGELFCRAWEDACQQFRTH
jgi:lysophospholipase L1-like esterase